MSALTNYNYFAFPHAQGTCASCFHPAAIPFESHLSLLGGRNVHSFIMQLDTILSFSLLLSIASATTNLFDDGQIEPILGTSFGIPGTNATYDYIVVGGGNAGVTIAARLAEEPSVSVAVIEAGQFYEIDNGNLSVIPGSATFFTGSNPSNYNPLIDWGFDTTPQPVRLIPMERTTSSSGMPTFLGSQ